jgi:protein-tyrosine phosphatase
MRIPFCLLFLFQLALAHAQVADSAQRKLQLKGAVNCRDIGGYATKDGHHVKWNKLYRSAEMSKLTDSDLLELRQRQISTVVDFRGVEESKRAPDHLNVNMDYLLCPAGSDSSLVGWMKTVSSLKSGGDSMMISYYGKTEFFAARYKPFFQKLIALPDGQAILYHCTAGKDRTGIGTALLLYSLGVPYETILNDYLASNYYRRSENEKMVHSMINGMHMNEDVAWSPVSVKKEYLDATFEAIREQYGSVDNFLKNELDLDQTKIDLIKTKFLQ